MCNILRIFQNKKVHRLSLESGLQSDHQIHDKILQMLHPFHCLLLLLFSSKYSVKDNYITPNGTKRKFASFLSTSYVIIVTIYSMYFKNDSDTYTNLHGDDIVVAIIVFLENMSHCSGIIMIFVTNIVHRHDNVSLIVIIQRLFKSIDIKESVHSITIWNWIFASIIFGVNFFIFTAYHIAIKTEISDFPVLIRNYLFITFNVSYAYAIFVITLLTKFLNEWRRMLSKLNEEREFEALCTHLLKTYQNILKAYRLYRTVCQGLILFITITVLRRNLFFLWKILLILKKPTESQIKQLNVFKYPIIDVTTTLWITKDIFLVICHSIQCEKFYIAVEEAKMACIQLLKSKNCPNDQLHLYKEVLREGRNFKKVSAYGLMYVDAKLPITVIGLLTGYVIVLLQFNLL